MTISPLQTATERAFVAAYFEHTDNPAIFSPRSGERVNRGTGYIVYVTQPFEVDVQIHGRGHSFLELLQFVLTHRDLLDVAAQEPSYLVVEGNEHTLSASVAVVVNDRREALALSQEYGSHHIFDIAIGARETVEYPSAAARKFQQDVKDGIDPLVTDFLFNSEWDDEREFEVVAALEAKVDNAPVEGVLLRTVPGLEKNPWNTDYIRSHL